MLIALSESCPIFGEESRLSLHRFLTSVVTRRHILVQPAPSKLQQVLSDDVWEVYGDYLKQSFKAAANGARKWQKHDNCGDCNSALVAEFYALPLTLVLENAETDGGWLRLVVDKLRPRLRRDFDGASPGIDVRQAGGIGEIPKELERLAPANQRARPSQRLPIRLIAMCDSDASAPGQLSRDALAVQAAAARVGAIAHVLSKRSIENYIPDNALLRYSETRRDAAPAVRHLEGLDRAQRDHYPLKSGLKSSDIGPSSIFPDDSPTELQVGDFMRDFLSSFTHVVDARELLARDGCGELELLLDLLEENL